MGKIFIEAILLGLTLSILVGPVFFALIQTSIRRGFKAGIFFAIGIFFSDFTCILLTNWGISQFVNDPKYANIISITGGILLILFGLYEILNKEKQPIQNEFAEEIAIQEPKMLTHSVKAFFMNILTPSVFLFWIFWAAQVNARYSSSKPYIIIFFLITLLTVFATDTLKVYIANQLKQIMTEKVLLLVRRIAGGLLIVFGIYLSTKCFF
ncbi:MAG: LysE family transporter [Bacteroidota bacterium]